MRGSIADDASDHVEPRRSLGIKKCCSTVGVPAAELVADAPGNAGIGGGSRPGELGGDRTVTPGMYAIWMTLDALLRTVEATDRLEAWSAANVDAGFSDGTQPEFLIAFRLGFIQKCHRRNVITATAAMPATTPPTMGPMGVFGFSASWPGSDPIFKHEVDAHASHDCCMRLHVSSEAQLGQAGCSFGHCTHRLNSDLGEGIRSINSQYMWTKMIRNAAYVSYLPPFWWVYESPFDSSRVRRDSTSASKLPSLAAIQLSRSSSTSMT